LKPTVCHLSLPKDGETQNGDAVLIREEGSRVLLALVDALGHGPGASAVAAVAVAELEAAPLDGGLAAILDRLHRGLRNSRGAAALVCTIDGAGRLEACSVGNVELRSVGTRLPVTLTPGILGAKVRSFRIFSAQLAKGDRLVAFSDGISARSDLAQTRGIAPAQLCELLMRELRRPHDDATVLVADMHA
jgi:negative regulator of sigma-B (phosphoserine phosphatase)